MKRIEIGQTSQETKNCNDRVDKIIVTEIYEII